MNFQDDGAVGRREYLETYGWKFDWINKQKARKRGNRKLFSDENFQLMRPVLYKEVFV